jgi:hypothetical protein
MRVGAVLGMEVSYCGNTGLRNQAIGCAELGKIMIGQNHISAPG